MMQALAPVDNIRFDIENDLDRQTFAVVPLPFIGMDKSTAAICEYYVKSPMGCAKENLCPFRHPSGDKSVICKHWLRGLCKKGDECEFLHEYDMSKMPECYFYSKFSQCGNRECDFLHLDRESKIKDCPWYDRGFCRHGPNCKNRHVKKVICQNYLFGFCPEGSTCKFKHPKFDLPLVDAAAQQKKQLFVCDYCGEKGHKIASCFKLNPDHRNNYQAKQMYVNSNPFLPIHQQQQQRTLSDLSNENSQNFSNPSTSSNPTNGTENTDKENSTENQSHDILKMQNQPQSTLPAGSSYPQLNPRGHHFNNPTPNNNHSSYNNTNGFNNNNQFPHHHMNHNDGKTPMMPMSTSEVTCFKCGEKGHYANRCNKTLFSFLRSDEHPPNISSEGTTAAS